MIKNCLFSLVIAAATAITLQIQAQTPATGPINEAAPSAPAPATPSASAPATPSASAPATPSASAPATPSAPAPATTPEAAAPPREDRTLNVVYKPVKPFVFEQNGADVGYSIDLWKRIASESGIKFNHTTVKTVPEMLTALENGTADVGVGALSITAERQSRIDFSYPFYRSGLQILVDTKGGGSSPIAAFKGLLRPDVMGLLGFLIVALIVNSVLMWLLERKRNAESFPNEAGPGFGESFWWSICTILTGGCENKAPVGFLGRVLAVIWMLAGVALFTTVQGLITSAMTVSTLTSDVNNIQDLRGKEVATVGGSTAEKFLKNQGVTPKPFETVDDAVNALAAGQVKAVVYDAPILKYLISQRTGTTLQLVGGLIEKQNYGIGLTKENPDRKLINQTLLRLQEEGFFEELERKWFGTSGTDE